MSGEDMPSRQCSVDTPVDLPQMLERLGVEFLDVDDTRLIAIYRNAIFKLTAATTISATREFEVELWEPPRQNATRDATGVFEDFVDELSRILDTEDSEESE